MDAVKRYFQPGPRNISESEHESRHEAPTISPNLASKPVKKCHNGSHISSASRTLYGSTESSIYPDGDFRNAPREMILDVKIDVMATWVQQQQLEKCWATDLPGEGVVLKKGKNKFACVPESLRDEPSGFFNQVVALNVRCAMTVNTKFIKIFLIKHTADYVPLADGLRLQVLPSVDQLHRCQKHHYAAFVQDQQILIVWDDHPRNLLKRATCIEDSLMSLIWDERDIVDSYVENPGSFLSRSKLPINATTPDILEAASSTNTRPTVLLNSMMVGLTLALLIAALGLGWRAMAYEIYTDGNFKRLALLVVTPYQVFVSLFFMQVIIVNLAQIFGPISQLQINSKFYSGIAPDRLNRNTGCFPHMTIQMPVYKEGLVAVIQPSIESLKRAISTYELQGGTANIFVNDDGMQLLHEDEARARREFYEEHNIGWVARPKHNLKPEGDEKVFLRRGKFKKASNMNYCLMISNKVEDKLLKTKRHEKWSHEEENAAYTKCLDQVLLEDSYAWAGGDIRVGDYILLIDSDTRVPADCLLDAASEMENSLEVGILQYSSGVMQITESFFENGIAFFTRLIYTAISYTVATGDSSPFVGHNAVLRWSAVQQISYQDEDGYEKFWSESHVSEDFDMSLRMQVSGYTIRLGAYTGDGFQEGVSLTVYDELSRWEKYAYGCNELLFHPLRLWFTRGPWTPLFWKFITSNIRTTSKITIMAYIGTYYAIGAAWILTLLNYFLVGWFNGYLDKYYLDSFRVYFSLIIVFSILGNVSLAILRYRLSQKSLFGALLENLTWLILLSCFLGGVSLHISQALLCHFFEIDMSWGATAKEVEKITFFEELPRLFRRFKFTFLFCFACTALMIVCAVVLPWQWRITEFEAVYPLCTLVVSHFALPVVLNPALMMFTY